MSPWPRFLAFFVPHLQTTLEKSIKNKCKPIHSLCDPLCFLQVSAFSVFFSPQTNQTQTFDFLVNNLMEKCFYFTHIQILILLSWNFDLFDLWTSVIITPFTRSLLNSFQLTVSLLTHVWKHHHNVLPLTSHIFSIGHFYWQKPVTSTWDLWRRFEMESGLRPVPSV